MRNFVLYIAFLIGLSVLTPARAADNVVTAQSIIKSQVEAFRRDDATTAYSYASPTVQGIYQQAGNFLGMVQKSFAPVYRHKSFEFGEAQVADGMIAQHVHIVDTDGTPWEALYTLEIQPDGSLKIGSCVLLKQGPSV